MARLESLFVYRVVLSVLVLVFEFCLVLVFKDFCLEKFCPGIDKGGDC